MSIGAVIAIVGVILSSFAGGGGGTPAASGAAAGGTATSAAAGPVDPSAQQSCASFDQATARLAAKDTKGFVTDMTDAATAAQAAAGRDSQWQLLVGQFAAFATDLSANDATSVYNDLNAINDQCAAVRGERQLVLNTEPAPAPATTAGPAAPKPPVPTTRPASTPPTTTKPPAATATP